MNYRIRLDMFEGPLDLLLYLIKEEELNIFDIPIIRITEQYLEYLSLMEMLDLEVAGDFLVMAATLIQIKSRMLLPVNPDGIAEDEPDPRAELVRRLLEYKAFKEAAERLRGFESKQSGIFPRFGIQPEFQNESDLFQNVSLFDLLAAFNKVLKSLEPHAAHEIVKDEYTVAEKIHEIIHRLVQTPLIRFSKLFKTARNKIEAITIFLAILELTRMKEVVIKQDSQFGEIEISKNIQAVAARPPVEETPASEPPAGEV